MSVQIIGSPLRKRAKLLFRILIEIDRNSPLSDLNVQKQGVECQQAQATRYGESSSARSDDTLHQRLSTQSIVNLKSVPAKLFIDDTLSFEILRYHNSKSDPIPIIYQNILGREKEKEEIEQKR